MSPLEALKRTVRPTVRAARLIIRRKPADPGEDPILAALARAPVGDPLTDDERRVVAEGWDAYRRGETMTAAEAKRECLTPEDADRSPPVGAVAGSTN
jgi:hypothetical protein